VTAPRSAFRPTAFGESSSPIFLPTGAALVVGPTGHVLVASTPFPLPHLSPSILQGRSLEEIEPPALGQSLSRLWRSFCQDGSLQVSEMQIGLEPRDPVVHCSLSLGAVAHPDFPDLCVITVRDVKRHSTEVQDLLGIIQALREQCTRWEVATRTTAHDVRSSLSAMTGFLQLSLRDPVQLPAGIEERLVQALQIGKRLQGLLADIEKNREPQALDVGPVAMAPLGHRLFQALHAAYPDVAFTWHVESPDAAARASMSITWSVLWNVLTNAVKYRRANRALHIGLRAWVAEGAMQLEVRDSGKGIPEGEEEAVFGWTHRCAGPDGVEGSGFGLFAARQRLVACGGRIWVEPASDGALVRITLPLEDEQPLPREGSSG
jgi:signal transduction histidine kinase